MLTIDGGTAFVARGAREVSRGGGLDQFLTEKNVHLVTLESSFTDIPPPKILGIQPAEVHFCGPFFLLPNLGKVPDAVPKKVMFPDMTLSRLSDVVCLPGQVAIVQPPSSGQPTILTESFNSWWDRGTHQSIHRSEPGTFYLRKPVGKIEDREGTFLFLDNQHGRHFGHFLVDVIPLSWAFTFVEAIGLRNIKVLVTQDQAAFMRPLLRAVGIPDDALVELTHPIRCREVIFATKSYQTQGWTSPFAIDLWRRIREQLAQNSVLDKVFISRGRVGSRALQQADLVDRLFERSGFTIIYPENIPIQDQVSAFANATYIAGVSGSNMFGLAFQQKLKASFTITSPNLLVFSEAFLQASYKSSASIYVGRAPNREVHGPWEVDLNSLDRSVQDWLAQTEL